MSPLIWVPGFVDHIASLHQASRSKNSWIHKKHAKTTNMCIPKVISKGRSYGEHLANQIHMQVMFVCSYPHPNIDILTITAITLNSDASYRMLWANLPIIYWFYSTYNPIHLSFIDIFFWLVKGIQPFIPCTSWCPVVELGNSQAGTWSCADSQNLSWQHKNCHWNLG